MQTDDAITFVAAGVHGATAVTVLLVAIVVAVEFDVCATTANRFEIVRDPNLPFALTLSRTTQDPFAFVVNLPVLSTHAPETLQDFAPLEFDVARVEIVTTVEGGRLLTLQVILGEDAALAVVPSRTKLIDTTTTRTFVLRTIIFARTPLESLKRVVAETSPRLAPGFSLLGISSGLVVS